MSIVVGAGIIGSTSALALREAGLDVLLLDAGKSGCGTKPSGGHLKPSWMGAVPKHDYIPAMDLLDELWGLIKEEFIVRPIGTNTTVYRVDTDKVLGVAKTQGRVTEVQLTGKLPVVYYDGLVEQCRLLLIATGVWASELVEGVVVDAKKGISFRVSGTLDSPFIKPWAPYKQIVAHQQQKSQIWVGDGTAILKKNWDTTTEAKCVARCLKALGKDRGDVLTNCTGLRAYCDFDKSAPCLFKQLGERAWLATGAGKSGTIAAGWVARRILNEAVRL